MVPVDKQIVILQESIGIHRKTLRIAHGNLPLLTGPAGEELPEITDRCHHPGYEYQDSGRLSYEKPSFHVNCGVKIIKFLFESLLLTGFYPIYVPLKLVHFGNAGKKDRICTEGVDGSSAGYGVDDHPDPM
jgi:hypothetical protein